jgi:hypothetical protein
MPSSTNPLSNLLAEMRQLVDDAAEIGEFRNADGTPNYEAVNCFMRHQIVIHGGEEPGAGFAAFPLSYCALQMLTPEERDRAFDLAWPLEEQIAFSTALREEFERRFPAARRVAPPEPEVPPEPAVETPRGIVARVLRRVRR